MRIVVTGGGTGGHIYPALAVAEAMRADPAVAAVTYLGKAGGLESELVPQASIDFEGVVFSGMPRNLDLTLPFRLLGWAFQLLAAVSEAKRKLRRLKPDVVFGTGGYVSAPVLMAARDLKIPYVVHEPDAQPGLVNRLMARDARVITTSFSEGAERLKRHPAQEVLVTGNPIRGAIGKLTKAQALKQLGLGWPPPGHPDHRPVLLVTGGSQGARRLNFVIAEILPTLLYDLRLAVVHLTGKKLYDETLAQLDQFDVRLKDDPHYCVRPYSPDMAALLALADIAVCRAGSLSLSEMYVCGVPTILVPYPFAAADHQTKNAQASVRAGASVMLADADCKAGALQPEIRRLVTQPERRQAMAAAAKALGHPDATQQIVARLKQFAR